MIVPINHDCNTFTKKKHSDHTTLQFGVILRKAVKKYLALYLNSVGVGEIAYLKNSNLLPIFYYVTITIRRGTPQLWFYWSLDPYLIRLFTEV